ncbi:MAG: creatininase family protein [Sedimentibacter saalensis]|uniref:creatininase family protein n=1 Tax=Sedimentibacter saalensis TaxID=130788 RepID=UPI0011A92D68|nr:creatininase family protein [Sedimentibacter saalensis]MEA5096222.1 creatininase family protein [Sedimentibacter saalensis]
MFIVPLGSVENYGSHLGLGTDFIIPNKIVELLERKVDILSILVMPFGMVDHHMNFPGTFFIGNEGLFLIMTKIT